MDYKKIEDKWRKKWEETKAFDAEPIENKEKFFMTIPYPYISGSLHIGHARVVTEADVFTRYKRMAGYNTLFPIAFHISGTPVLGISLAIKNNDEKTINLYKNYVKKYVKNDEEVKKTVKSFEDPKKIVEFFIPKMINEFKILGLSVDYRRSFTSGDIEHQALVEWQFQKYKEKGYVVQGKYPILYSKTLENAVGEDDIKEGDTNPVEIQEFTLIKFKLEKENEFLIAATLRPETMYGQTNMWVHPDVDYVKAKVGDETWIISKEASEKLQYQDKEVEILEKIKGKNLIGKNCFAPFVEREIIILPSKHCDPEIATGIVTSVPSDAPFDYISLKLLQESAEECEKYNLDQEKIKNLKPIKIIDSKGYNDYPAKEICQKLKINSLDDNEKLNEATQEIYKLGFHTGVMSENCGPYFGKKVTEAKEEMREALIKSNRAEIFYETSRKANSRDGGEVIVAILDNQWFLNFNADSWKELSKECLDNMEIIPDKYRKQFNDVFDWLDKRPCARKRGLGTMLPFDKNWVIESLSDSTAYMSLYPIMHKIRENNLTKDQLNYDFFEYITSNKITLEDCSNSTNIGKELLKSMKKEWNYWYPVDQRHTFSAHLSNHLSFMIFAHTALFSKEKWPKKISFHGMILANGEKMSKSKGNVVTILDIKEKYGADAFRAFMCSATSVESTLNWDTDKVEIIKKQLKNIYETIDGMIENSEENKDYLKNTAFISKFETSIKKAIEGIKEMDLRTYANVVLYEIPNLYKKIIKKVDNKQLKSINNYISKKWIVLMNPLIPHISEELWEKLGKNTLASKEKFVKADETLINPKEEFKEDIVDNLIKDIYSVKKLVKLEKINNIKILTYKSWKKDFFEIIKSKMEETRNPKDIIQAVMSTDLKKHSKDVMKMIPSFVKEPAKLPLFIFSKEEENQLLEANKKLIEQEFDAKVEIIDGDNTELPKAKNANPGKPAILID